MTVLRGPNGGVLVVGFPNPWSWQNDIDRLIADFQAQQPGTAFALALGVFPADKLHDAHQVFADELLDGDRLQEEGWEVVVP